MQAVKLGILHTNDTHSYLDLFGQRAHLIKGLRARYEASLLLGAGDLFVGGPYFQLFAGQAEIGAKTAKRSIMFPSVHGIAHHADRRNKPKPPHLFARSKNR